MNIVVDIYNNTTALAYTSAPSEPNTVLFATIILQQLDNVKLVVVILDIGLRVMYIISSSGFTMSTNFNYTKIT